MGYTHYWRMNDEGCSDETWDKISRSIMALVVHEEFRGIRVCGGDGTRTPLFTDESIEFNGSEDGDLYHEPCTIERNGEGFNFCKTAHKPYDALVVASLLVLYTYHGGVTKLTSDGGEDGILAGLWLCEKVLGFGTVQMPDRDDEANG